MRHILWFLVGIGFALVIGTVSLPEQSSAETLSPASGVIATSTIISLTNGDRISLGLPALRADAALEAAAQMKADNMAAQGYFAHNTPDGKNPWYWFKKAGYAFLYAGENLAIRFSTPAAIEKAWMASPGHRRNIVNGNYSDIGVGIAYGTYQGSATAFVVELFGSRSVLAY